MCRRDEIKRVAGCAISLRRFGIELDFLFNRGSCRTGAGRQSKSGSTEFRLTSLHYATWPPARRAGGIAGPQGPHTGFSASPRPSPLPRSRRVRSSVETIRRSPRRKSSRGRGSVERRGGNLELTGGARCSLVTRPVGTIVAMFRGVARFARGRKYSAFHLGRQFPDPDPARLSEWNAIRLRRADRVRSKPKAVSL